MEEGLRSTCGRRLSVFRSSTYFISTAGLVLGCMWSPGLPASSFIHKGRREGQVITIREIIPSYGALKMIAAVHLFCYSEEKTAARISKWISLTFKSAGKNLFECWYTIYFYLRKFQYTLPTDMHSKTTLYLKLLSIVDRQIWWQHPL